MAPDRSALYLSPNVIDTYLQRKLDAGISPVAVDKYRTPLRWICEWFGEAQAVTLAELQRWRKKMEDSGYSKSSVQNNVSVVNGFLRWSGHEELCIPKPLRCDLRGRTFGYLTALEPTEKRHRKDILWKCSCKCGKETEVPATMLMQGNTTSCGCLNVEILKHCNLNVEGTNLRQSLLDNPYSTRSVSGYTGVQPKRGKWVARISYKGVKYYLGTYTNIDDAVKARARAKELVLEDAAKLYQKYEHQFEEMPHRPSRPVKEPAPPPSVSPHPARRSDNTSGHTGVSRQYDKWNVSICVRGKRYRLGAYESLDDAVAVRKQAEQLAADGALEQLKAISTNRITA